MDRFHHSYRFSFGWVPISPPCFLGDLNVETFPAWFEAPKDTHVTPAPETGFLRPGWVYTDIAPQIRGKKLGNRAMARNDGNNPWQIILQNIFFWGLILVLRVFGMGMSSNMSLFCLKKSLCQELLGIEPERSG